MVRNAVYVRDSPFNFIDCAPARYTSYDIQELHQFSIALVISLAPRMRILSMHNHFLDKPLMSCPDDRLRRVAYPRYAPRPSRGVEFQWDRRGPELADLSSSGRRKGLVQCDFTIRAGRITTSMDSLHGSYEPLMSVSVYAMVRRIWTAYSGIGKCKPCHSTADRGVIAPRQCKIGTEPAGASSLLNPCFSGRMITPVW